MSLEVKVVEKKPPALKPFSFGCLKGSHAVNLTRGCLHRCVYCYARGYPSAPDQVELYGNLLDLASEELRSPLKRKRLKLIVFNTASDSFQPHPQILELAHGLMELLLKEGLPLYFLTKGHIPSRTMELMSRYRGLVFPHIGLCSLDKTYNKTFEPNAAPPEERLRAIREMASLGITPGVRIDPLIPFLTDREENLRELFSALSAVGVKEVVLNYLHIRPGIEEIMQRELGQIWFRVSFPYRGQPWRTVGSCSRAKLLPLPFRRKKYQWMIELARSYGLRARICRCKNPDLEADSCLYLPPLHSPLQLGLFN